MINGSGDWITAEGQEDQADATKVRQGGCVYCRFGGREGGGGGGGGGGGIGNECLLYLLICIKLQKFPVSLYDFSSTVFAVRIM